LSKASQIRQKAQEFLSKGQTDKAVQEYRRLISIESKNPNLYNELGDIFLRAGDKSQAVQNFEKAAVIYEKVALYNNAVAVCKKILRIEPEKTETVFRLAELRAKQKLEGEAVGYFTQYVELVLASPEGMQRSQKDVERIVELMGTSEPILAKAVEVFERLGLKLKTAATFATLSAIAGEKGDEKKQVHYRRRAEEFSAGLSALECDSVNAAFGSRGGPAETVAPSVEAGPAEEAAAAAGADESAGGNAPTEGAETEAAAPGDDAGTERDAGSAEGAAEAVEAPREAREEEDAATGNAAVEAANEAVEEAEMVAAMGGGREFFAAGGSAPEPAKVAAKAATESRSDGAVATETPPRPAPGGRPPEERSAPEQAANLAEEITSDVEKDDFRSHYDLGMAYLEMGLYTEAIKDFQIASRSADLQVSSMEMIGYCFLKHDQPRLAVKQLNHALAIAKSSGADTLGIHYNLGLAYELLGELPSAREHFEEVYIIDMTFRDVADKMKTLTSGS
jgi:tetratricopeptide (TPR) repeat protein